jgi:mycoredoxin
VEEGPSVAGSLGVDSEQENVILYWRPGCPYCVRLRRGLQRAGASVVEVNIWEKPSGAAAVRAVTGGDETVPTLVVGYEPLVNPSIGRALESIRSYAPGLIDPTADVRSRGGTIFVGGAGMRWVLVGLVVAASFVAEATGRASLGWGIDAVAVAAFALTWIFRRNGHRSERVRGA